MIKKIDKETYEVDGVQVWISVVSGRARCTECSSPLKGMSASCKHARSVARLTKRALDGRKRGAKSKSLNGKGSSKAARQ